jgi:hypothetical protein
MKNLEDEEGGLPYFVPQPIDPDEAHDILYPTSPPIERADSVDDDSPLMPPLMDS